MDRPRFTLRQLDAFLTVAELRSFTAASDRLALTASAVSQLVSELEAALGFRVFDRSTRKVALSAAGREFVSPAENVLKQMQRAESAAADVRNRAAGVVRIAAPLVVASTLLPPAIKAYAALQPKVVVRIRDASVESLADMVAAGDADLALGPDRISGDEVQRTTLFPSPWVLWCSPEHALARKRSVRWSDLREHAIVAAGRDHERSVAQMRRGLPDDERITPIEVVDNISTALGIAAANLAATLSPAYVGALAQPLGLLMRRIVDPEVMRYMSIYRPALRPASPAAEGFEEFVAQWVTAHHAKTRFAQRRRIKP